MTCLLKGICNIYKYIYKLCVPFLPAFLSNRFCINSWQLLQSRGVAAAAAKEGEKKALPTKSPLQQVGILKLYQRWMMGILLKGNFGGR